MLYQYILAYGYYFLSLIPIISAGILFFRTKTKATGMFFFGSLFALASTPIWFLLGSKIELPQSGYPVIMVIAGVASFVSSIGLLLYALSLPKFPKT